MIKKRAVFEDRSDKAPKVDVGAHAWTTGLVEIRPHDVPLTTMKMKIIHLPGVDLSLQAGRFLIIIGSAVIISCNHENHGYYGVGCGSKKWMKKSMMGSVMFLVFSKEKGDVFSWRR